MNLILKQKKYSQRTMVNNITKVYMQTSAEDRYDWYMEAHNFAIELSKQCNYTLAQCCGVIAAFSPLKRWDKNKYIAQLFLAGQRDGLHTKLCTGKAIQILTAEDSAIDGILRGEKITAFYNNLLKPSHSDHITIDRHAIAIAINKRLPNDGGQIKSTQYNAIRAAYAKTAAKIGISPLLLQSSTWVLWRKQTK